MFSFLFFLSETIPLIFFDPFSDRILCSKPTRVNAISKSYWERVQAGQRGGEVKFSCSDTGKLNSRPWHGDDKVTRQILQRFRPLSQRWLSVLRFDEAGPRSRDDRDERLLDPRFPLLLDFRRTLLIFDFTRSYRYFLCSIFILHRGSKFSTKFSIFLKI